jgi:phosphatidyl-myo-inositol alpha-mannosyltransferase
MENPLKIAMVLDDSLDKTDGVQQYVLTLGEYLRSIGNEVHYLVGETTRTDIPNIHSLSRNVKVRFNQNRMSIPLPAPKKRIRKLLTHEEFDIVHVQMPYSPQLAGRIVNLVSSQTAVVGTFHVAPHSKLVHFGNWLLRQVVSRSLARFDEIISVSHVAQDFAWETFGVESSIVPNTIELEPFYVAKSFPKYLNAKTIVFLGRLVERKGCQQLLNAIVRLRELDSRRDYKVVICGIGPLEASLKEFVRANKLTDTVEFVGFITEADKPRWLASADIAVFPSTGGESFGIVLLEAMAAGRGVVLAGNNPGYASVIGERPEALFDPHDADQLAEKLQTYLAGDAARAKARSWQQQYVRQFDVPNVADEILVLYDQALHKRRS